MYMSNPSLKIRKGYINISKKIAKSTYKNKKSISCMLRDRLFAVNLFGVAEECRLEGVIHPYKRRNYSIKVVEEVTQTI